MGVSLLSSFTGAASQNMACFIAGTTILTATGFVEIEKLAAGDKVISTNPDTLETAEKTVLETYVRQVDKLVHITINGEKIVTTDNHPFYVQGRGFIEAGNLLLGDKLVSVNGEDLIVEDYHIELTEDFVSVYNFQVEDFHTYFVGKNGVLVHNAGNEYKPVSKIGENTNLVKEAEKACKNQQVQNEMNHLINEFLRGNSNPGIGSKNLFKDICYLRGRNGGRVFYRMTNGTMEILAKANKGNEQNVINILKKLYGG